MFALFASIISWARQSIDRSSDLWQTLIDSEPIQAINPEDSLYKIIFGLFVLLMFTLYIGQKARTAFAVYRGLPTGFLGTIFISIVWFFFDRIASLWEALYGIYQPSLDENPPTPQASHRVIAPSCPQVIQQGVIRQPVGNKPAVNTPVVKKPVVQTPILQEHIQQPIQEPINEDLLMMSYVENQIDDLIGIIHSLLGTLIISAFNIGVEILKSIFPVTGSLFFGLFTIATIVALSQLFGAEFTKLFVSVLEIAWSWVTSSFALLTVGTHSVLAIQAWLTYAIEARFGSKVLSMLFFFSLGALTVGMKKTNDWFANVWYGIFARLFGLGIWVTALWMLVARLFSQYSDFVSDYFLSLSYLDPDNTYLFISVSFVIAFKLCKTLVHSITYRNYRPSPMTASPKFSPSDVTVMVTIRRGESGTDKKFLAGLDSILENGPAKVIIATKGLDRHKLMNVVSVKYSTHRVKVTSIAESNLRRQFIKATDSVETKIVCHADSGICWSPVFLLDALTPFDDENVDLVGVPTIMNRVAFVANPKLAFSGLRVNWRRFLHYLASIYYERYNFDSQAANNIDGGIQAVSSRTALIRTDVVQSSAFRLQFITETWLFGQIPSCGGMRVDAAEFITRFVLNSGKKTVFRTTPHSTISIRDSKLGFFTFCRTITLGYRSTWRSNLTSLFSDGKCCWYRTSWTTYSMFIMSLANFSMFYDSLMVYLLWRCCANLATMTVFGIILLYSKVIKQLAHLNRNPSDWWFVPAGIIFGYFCSFLKLFGMLTVWNIESEPS